MSAACLPACKWRWIASGSSWHQKQTWPRLPLLACARACLMQSTRLNSFEIVRVMGAWHGWRWCLQPQCCIAGQGLPRPPRHMETPCAPFPRSKERSHGRMRTLSFTPLPAPNPPLTRTMVRLVVFTGCVPTATSWRLNSAPRRLCCRRLVRSWRTCVQSWLMPLHEQPVPRTSSGKCQRPVVLCRSLHCTLMHHNDPELRSNHSIRASQAYRGKWILCLSHLTRQPHRGYVGSVVCTACLILAIDTPVAL